MEADLLNKILENKKKILEKSGKFQSETLGTMVHDKG